MMSQNAPPAIDIQNIQFKLHRKVDVFTPQNKLKNVMHLLAVAPNKGLMFVGNPYESEFKILKLNEINASEKEVTVRILPLISAPLALACNCDGSLLAVNYIYNNNGFLQIFLTDTFLKPNISALYTLPVASEQNVNTAQLLWNPVVSNNLCIILNDGSAGMLNLNDNGQYEKHVLNKEQQIKCGCWSPKGKQIVFGLGSGNLQQFKPNFASARTIHSPYDLHQQPFDIKAVHWLSTYQFAVILLTKGAELLPCLYIVNAPKTGEPTFINYYDICYSGPGPRQHQFIFTHIPAWNILLLTSANGVEVGVLGTKEKSIENPVWLQYALLDEARIEMPLTNTKEETYPMGFVLDTSCSHHLTFGEKELPVQPIVHVLSTNGQLISFNFLNFFEGVSSICSPHPPMTDTSGEFIPLALTVKYNSQGINDGAENITYVENIAAKPNESLTEEAPFSMVPCNIGTSTPAQKEKSSFVFPNNTNNNVNVTTFKPFNIATTATTLGSTVAKMDNVFATSVTPTTSVNLFTSGLSENLKTNNYFGQTSLQNNFNNSPNNNNNIMLNPGIVAVTCTPMKFNDVNKPLYTVSSTYEAPPHQTLSQHTQQQNCDLIKATNKMNEAIDISRTDEVINCMIRIEIDAFNIELKYLKNQSLAAMSKLDDINEVESLNKKLNDLQEIIDLATDREFESDVKVLQVSLEEVYVIIKECRAKLDLHQNPDYARLTISPYSDASNRRQLIKLRSYLATNENDLQQLQQLLEMQWHEFQEILQRNTKEKIHTPYFDGIYRKISRIKEHLGQQRRKLQVIKNKMMESGFLYNSPNVVNMEKSSNTTSLNKEKLIMDSLNDSMISMSLGEVFLKRSSLLTQEKLQALRNFTKQQNHVNIIRPKRPNRICLNSEVILETKLKAESKKKEQKKLEVEVIDNTTASHLRTEQQHQSCVNIKSQASIAATTSQSKPNVAKPQASKPQLISMNVNTFNSPSVATSSSSNLNISSSSSFVKTSNATNDHLSSSNPMATSTPFTAYAPAGPCFTCLQPQQQQHQQQQSKMTDKNTKVPVSFNAKIVQSNQHSEQNLTNAPMSSISTNQLGMKAIGKDQQALQSANSLTSPLTKASKSHSVTACMPGFVGFNNPITSMATINTMPTFNKNVAGSAEMSSSSATNISSVAKTATATAAAMEKSGEKFDNSSNTIVTNATKAPGMNFDIKTSKSFENTKVDINTGQTSSAPSDLTFAKSSSPETVLSSLNICSPSAKPATTTSLPFSFLSASANVSRDDGVKNIFGEVNPKGSVSESSTFNSSSALAQALPADTTIKSITTSIATTTATTTITLSTTIAATTITKAETYPSTDIKAQNTKSKTTPTTVTTSSSTFGVPSTSVSAAPMFSALNLSTAAATTTAASVKSVITSSTTPSSTGGNIFGGNSSFNSNSATTLATFTFTQSPNISSTAGSGNIFGGTAKSDQSNFSGVANTTSSNTTAMASNLFAAAAASTKPLSNVATTNIFGGSGSFTFNSSASSGGGSIFGGSTTSSSPFANAANSGGGSIFAGSGSANQLKSPTSTSNIFTSTSGGQVTSSGGIFAKSSFGQTPAASASTNIFNTQGQTTGTGNLFGGTSAGSIFGGSGTTSNASGSSLFGGAATAPAFGSTAPSGAQTFGAFSTPPAPGASAFGSPTVFAQSGASVQQTGFGSSPQQQQHASPFVKPVFGGPATFESPSSVFGGQPVFGGAPTFGSPKGFGSFSIPANSTTSPSGTGSVGGTMPFGAGTQAKTNIFETLGSSDSALSFGNLAQNTQQPAQPKPTFGGSSFMNYRS